jgi:hypothetical protein
MSPAGRTESPLDRRWLSDAQIAKECSMKPVPQALALVMAAWLLAAQAETLRSQTPQNAPQPAVAAPAPPINSQPGFFMNVAVDHVDGKYRGGETMSAKFQSEKGAYVYLLYQQADGKTVMIFPNKARPDNFVKARQVVSIPEAGQPFRFRIRAPFGEEWLQVVASEKPIEELAALDTSAGQAIPVNRELLDALAERVKRMPTRFGEHRVKLFTEPGEAPLAESLPAAKAALLIGVSKVKRPDILPPRPRYKNSPLLVAEAFTKLCGVDAKNVKLLVDEASSRPKIEEGITKWLPSVTQPGDIVYIYYHGHGGRVKNFDGTEADGWDEALFPADYDNPESQGTEFWQQMRERVVLDDTLARWLQELPGRQIVLLLDTCHSGGAIDAVPVNRFLDNEGERLHDVSNLNTIVITTALPDELSYGGSGEEKAVSFFSYFFVQAIEKLPRPINVRQAFEHYRVESAKFYKDNKLEGVQEPTYSNTAVLDVELAPRGQ